MSKIPDRITVGYTRFGPGVDTETVQGAIDRLQARYVRVESALSMGLQLGESGKHGDGEKCPTCHFVREARKALK